MTTHGTLSDAPDYLAPDGSQIRLAGEIAGVGSLCEVTLPPGATASPVRHRTVQELWLCVSGQGQVWRAAHDAEGDTIDVRKGVWLTLPLGIRFQFRNTGTGPLRFVAATVPPWPEHNEGAAEEAVPATGPWPT